MNKIRTDKQLERLNFLLVFKSKEEIADMLIDSEEKVDKAIEYIKYINIEPTFTNVLLEILGGKE